MTKQHRLQLALESWQNWNTALRQKPEIICELGSGETNQSFLITDGAHKCVLRLDRPDAQVLGVNRAQEALIWRAAAQAKISPRLLYQNQSEGVLIYTYAEGRTWSGNDFHDQSQLEKLKSCIHEYQKIQIEIAPRNYHDYLCHYWQQIQDKDLYDDLLLKAWSDFLPRLKQFQNSDWQACLSHHDLIPQNIVETKNGIMILDWEYAALGHPDLDWSWVTGEKESAVSEVIHWINKLWHLLA